MNIIHGTHTTARLRRQIVLISARTPLLLVLSSITRMRAPLSFHVHKSHFWKGRLGAFVDGSRRSLIISQQAERAWSQPTAMSMTSYDLTTGIQRVRKEHIGVNLGTNWLDHIQEKIGAHIGGMLLMYKILMVATSG